MSHTITITNAGQHGNNNFSSSPSPSPSSSSSSSSSSDSSPAHDPGPMPSMTRTTAPSYTLRSGSLPADLRSARRPSAFASIVLRRKNEVEIELYDSNTNNTPINPAAVTYTTHDEIRGSVCLTFEKDTPIEDVIITFEGQSNTYVEKLASSAPTTSRTSGRHTFLKLVQPVQSQQLPLDSVLRAGQTYRIPFLFNVPEFLLPHVCSHKVEDECVHKQHLKLPPSLGNTSSSTESYLHHNSHGSQPVLDDLAPAMSRITYCVRARIIQRLNPNSKPVEIADQSERVRVIPQRDEEAPMTEPSAHADYCLRTSKTVRKGFLRFGQLGLLTAETSQPRSLRLPHPAKQQQRQQQQQQTASTSAKPVTTMTTIKLRFDPATPNDKPPQLGTLVTKLKAYTFFGAAPYRILPEIRHCDNWSSLHGVYSHTVELSSRNLGSVAWTRSDEKLPSTPLSPQQSADSCSSEEVSRRPSGISTISNATTASALSDATSSTSSLSSSSSPSSSSSSLSCSTASAKSPYYTASILVPVSLPLAPISSTSSSSSASSSPSVPVASRTIKTFVPSFHCCTISRSYTLSLSLSYSASRSAKVSSPSITLKTPIQISQEGGIPPPPLADEGEGVIMGMGIGMTQEPDEALVAEIERQFGIYEQRQINGQDEIQIQGREDEASPAYVEHGDIHHGQYRQSGAAAAAAAGVEQARRYTTPALLSGMSEMSAPPPGYHDAI